MPFRQLFNFRPDSGAATGFIAALAFALVMGAGGCASTPVAGPAAQSAPIATTTNPPAQAPGSVDTAAPPAMATTAADSPDGDQIPPTQAELDFSAIYGQPYDPVADPNLPEPARIGGAYDSWEGYNRKMHAFNNVIDRNIARPLARAYVAAVPRPIRLGVGNFFNNLGQPVTAINSLLQGKPEAAAQSMGRFVLNTTLGIGGIFDPATDASLDNRSEDFGQTLGIWGWQRSRYVELPLFGPRTVRDVLGMVGDAPLSPLRQVDEDTVRIPLQGLQLVDVRTQLLATDSLRVGVADDYALVRDAWMQRRDYQIFGERMQDKGETPLPDYLLEDNNPIVPVGAMPVMPPGN